MPHLVGGLEPPVGRTDISPRGDDRNIGLVGNIEEDGAQAQKRGDDHQVRQREGREDIGQVNRDQGTDACQARDDHDAALTPPIHPGTRRQTDD